MPQIVECDRITGEDCFILKIYLERLDDLDRVLDPFLAYGQTTTSLVQSSPVPRRPLPLPGEDRG
jgi:Lrp/AsnC family leucine-responsive transcriptional regulator